MRTFAFNGLPPLRDYQFLTDSSGYLLTQNGQLYCFSGQRATRVATPSEFTITQLCFRDQAHGALLGVAAAPPVLRGEASGAVLLGLLAALLYGRRRPQLGRVAACGIGLLAGGLLLSCSGAWRQYQAPDPTSPHAWLLSQPLLHRPSFHHYVGNKGVRSFIARTSDQGRSWDTQLIPSNFYPTALTAIGGNYLAGTYAREQAGTIPLHADGDLWLYGTDATRTPQLAGNSAQRPYCISLSRGVTGFLLAAADSLLYVFGSDRMPTLPSTVMSATAGNIYQLPTSLRPPTRLLDTPDTVDVHSLSRAATGELWATMAGRKPRRSHGSLGYVALPTRQLLRFAAGQWQPITAAGFTSFEQVEFVPGTASGYLLTETGQVLETRDHGSTWHLLPRRGVRKLHAWQHAITWLQGDGQLVFCPAPGAN